MKSPAITAIFAAFLAVGIFHIGSAHAAKGSDKISSSIDVDLPIDKIELAIVRAGAMKEWNVEEVEPGYLKASVRVREFLAVVDIRFDSSGYTISRNNTDTVDGGNKKFNRQFKQWIQRLDRDIAVMLTYM